MPKPLYKPPKKLIKEWPEVFGDIYINTMPINYLETITIEFKDGRIWEFDVINLIEKEESEKVADRVFEIFQEYKSEIEKVDFGIDIDKLKKDISDSSKNILD